MPIKNSTILTEKLMAQLCSHIKDGIPKDYACYLVGIGKATLYEWLDRGEQDVQKDTDSIFAALADSIKKAEAQFVALIRQRIEDAPPNAWTKWMTLGERLRPDVYGRADRLQVSGDADKPIPVTFTGAEKST